MVTGPVVQTPPIVSQAAADIKDVVSALVQGIIDNDTTNVISAVVAGLVDGFPDDVVSAITLGVVDSLPKNVVSAVVAGVADSFPDDVVSAVVAGIADTNPDNIVSAVTQGEVGILTREFTLASALIFSQFVRPNVHVFDYLSTNILFASAVNRQLTKKPSLVTAIAFSQFVKRGREESVSSSIVFSQEATRGEDPDNSLTFGQSVTVEKGTKAETPIVFSQTVVAVKVLNRSLTTGIVFASDVQGNNLGNCDEGLYTPTGSAFPVVTFIAPGSVSLTSASGSVVLRNPNYSNEETVELNRAFNQSRGGTFRVSRDAARPQSTRITVQFLLPTLTKRNELITFLDACLGELVTYIDQDGRTWIGIVENPQTAVSTQRDGSCGLFTATLEMLMDPS